MTEGDYGENVALLTNTPFKVKSLLHNLDQAASDLVI